MKKRLNENQKIRIAEHLATGTSVKTIAKKYGVHPQTIYVLKRNQNIRYKTKPMIVLGNEGIEVLERENEKLRKIVVDLLLTK